MNTADINQLRRQLFRIISQISSQVSSNSMFNFSNTDFKRVLFTFSVYTSPGDTVVQEFSLAPHSFSNASAFAFTDDENCRVSCRLEKDSDGLIRSVKILFHDFNAIEGSWQFGQSLPQASQTEKKVFVFVIGLD